MAPPSRAPAALLLVIVALSSGCGGKLLPLAGHETEPALAAGPDEDAGEDSGVSVVYEDPDGGDAPIPTGVCGGGPAPPPGCVASSTCNLTYFPMSTRSATGDWVGEFTFETITVSCTAEPTFVQQWIDGAWVSLEPWLPAVGDLPGAGSRLRSFDVDAPAGTIALPSAGAPVGSVQKVRACVTAYVVATGVCTSPTSVAAITTCDAPSLVTIGACSTCTPKRCPAGYAATSGCECVVQKSCPCGGAYPQSCVVCPGG